ncbi:AraC-like DNA-binding protein [Nakamurella sp. UYEF19]|uniref:helix-turn-helix domain-containing protein n=1 Tax=Nakamurella sp. UYEF19 TaxID=1756392 RepID=UPI0033982240
MTDTRGIVHPQVGLEHFRLQRYEPGERLIPYVDRLWCVSWNLEPGNEFEQPIFAHPAVNVVIEPQRAAVYGPPTRLATQRQSGVGWAVGVMFRPGGARPFLGTAAEWTDRVEPIADRWAGGASVVAEVRAVPGPAPLAEPDRVARVQEFLTALAPSAVPPDTASATAAAATIAADRQIRRVEDLAIRTGIEMRSLQRLFAGHIGLSPKKVIRRYRLLEAAEAVSTGSSVSWAQVAVDLGFSDQAHLTREFTRAFGVSPARYAGR